MIIVADTSALFARFDADQPEQTRIAAIIETETLAISPLVITELDHLVHRDLGTRPPCKTSTPWPTGRPRASIACQN